MTVMKVELLHLDGDESCKTCRMTVMKVETAPPWQWWMLKMLYHDGDEGWKVASWQWWKLQNLHHDSDESCRKLHHGSDESWKSCIMTGLRLEKLHLDSDDSCKTCVMAVMKVEDDSSWQWWKLKKLYQDDSEEIWYSGIMTVMKVEKVVSWQ